MTVSCHDIVSLTTTPKQPSDKYLLTGKAYINEYMRASGPLDATVYTGQSNVWSHPSGTDSPRVSSPITVTSTHSPVSVTLLLCI